MKIILATIKLIGSWRYQHCLAASTNFIDKIPGAIIKSKINIKDEQRDYFLRQ